MRKKCRGRAGLYKRWVAVTGRISVATKQGYFAPFMQRGAETDSMSEDRSVSTLHMIHEVILTASLKSLCVEELAKQDTQ